MNKRTFLSLASAVLICAGVYAQETAPTVITLEDALRIALSENVSVKVADKEIERAEYARKGTYASLFPQVDAVGSFQRTIKKQVMYMDFDMSSFGGMDGMRYKEYELTLTPGSRLFLYTDGLVLLGLITNFLPFAVLPMYSSIEKLQDAMLEASADLGAKPSTTFLRVTLPLTFPGIFSAIILTFIPALGTYTITDMLGGGKVLYIGNIIKNQFGTIRNWPLGAALSVLLLLITALLIFLYSRFASIEDMEVM